MVLFILPIVTTLEWESLLPLMQNAHCLCGALISLGAFLVSLLLHKFTDGNGSIVRPTVVFTSKMFPLFILLLLQFIFIYFVPTIFLLSTSVFIDCICYNLSQKISRQTS